MIENMKYLHRLKGMLLLAVACSFAAQGSAMEPAGQDGTLQRTEPSSTYSVSVSAGHVQNSQATANLTVLGENSKVSVDKEGTVTLVAGRSIILRPGTKISNGAFLYASIEPVVKNGRHQKKEVRVVTVEEKVKIEEQACLSMAYKLFSPFPSRSKGTLHAGDDENGCYTSSNTEIYAVTPEQQRKVAVDSRFLTEVAARQTQFNYYPLPVFYAYRAETMRVLRL